MKEVKTKYRSDIDGLRGLAVISVIAFHAFPQYLPGGFIGVDIFFVISGYLISKNIFLNISKNKFYFYDFYFRRAKRIFPALAIVILSCAGFGWLTLFTHEYASLGKHIASSTVFINNFLLMFESGYFDSSSDLKPLLHLWSLSIEEQFYIVWPLLIYLIIKYSGGGGREARNTLGASIVLLLVWSFCLNIYLTLHYPVIAFYLPLSRFWELLVGCALAYGYNTTNKYATKIASQPIKSLKKTSLIPDF